MYFKLLASLFLLILACFGCLSDEQVQRVILTTIDNVEIHAYHISNGKDTILIYCHRLLSSKESFHQLSIKDALLSEFDILAIDFRGHAQSGLASTCGGDEVLDLHSAIQYARNTGYKKIVLLGVGMGGGIAIREAGLFANVDAVIAINPCSQPEKLKPLWWNLATEVSLTTDYGRIPIRIISNTRVNGRYWTGLPINIINQVSPIPLMLIYDKSDRYLNREQVFGLYDMAKEPKKMLTLSKLKDTNASVIVKWIKASLSEQSSAITRLLQITPIQINEININGDVLFPETMIKEVIKASIDEKLGINEQLPNIKKSIENLYHSHGYTLLHVSDLRLSPNGSLSVNIKVDKIGHINVVGNHHVSDRQIQDLLRIPEAYYYNAWEIESAVKKLSQITFLNSVRKPIRE